MFPAGIIQYEPYWLYYYREKGFLLLTRVLNAISLILLYNFHYEVLQDVLNKAFVKRLFIVLVRDL